MCSLPLFPGHTEGRSDLFAMLNSEFKTCYMTCNYPLKKTQTKPKKKTTTTKQTKKPPQSTTDRGIMSSFNGLLLVVSLCDMLQGIRSFPIVRSASISSHVAMRTERSAFLSGTSRIRDILLWGSPAILNDSVRGENTVLGLILNMLLNEPKK